MHKAYPLISPFAEKRLLNLEKGPDEQANTSQAESLLKPRDDTKGMEETFSKEDIQKVISGEMTRKQLSESVENLRETASKELSSLDRLAKSEEESELLSIYKVELEKDLQGIKSIDELKSAIDKIRNAPSKIKEDSTELGLEHPIIEKAMEKIEKRIKNPDVKKWIGSGQVEPFIKWMQHEMKQKPSLQNAKKIAFELENHSSNGLKPRKEYFKTTLKPFLDKHKIGLHDAPYLEKEGFTERKGIMKHLQAADTAMDQLRKTGIYSQKSQQKIMKSILEKTNSNQIKSETDKLLSVARNEAKQYTDIHNSVLTQETITVHGKPRQAMSKTSVKIFLADYAEYDLQTRHSTILNWKKIAENEGKLIEELGDVYKDDPEGFEEAFSTFELMDYMQKKKAIESHKHLVKNNEKATLRKSVEQQREALAEVEKHRSQKILSTKTAKEFRTWVLDTKAYTNEKGNIDLEKQQSRYDQMTSETPVFDEKNRNLKAYEVRRIKFYKEFFEPFKKDHPNVPQEQFKKWETEYDEGSYSERKALYKQLKEERQNYDQEKAELEAEAKVEGAETSETLFQERVAIIKSGETALESADQFQNALSHGLVTDAIKQVFTFVTLNKTTLTKEPQLKELLDKLKAKRDTLELIMGGTNPDELNKDEESELKTDLEDVISSDEEVKKDMEELQVTAAADELITRSEEHYGKKAEAQDRNKDKSMATADGELEEEITEAVFEQGESTTILDDEGKGDEVFKIYTSSNSETSEQDLEEMYAEVSRRQHEDLTKQEGKTDLQLDKDNETENKEGRDTTIKRNKEELARKLEEKTEERAQQRRAVKGSNFSELAQNMAKARVVENTIEEKVHENLDRRAS